MTRVTPDKAHGVSWNNLRIGIRQVTGRVFVRAPHELVVQNESTGTVVRLKTDGVQLKPEIREGAEVRASFQIDQATHRAQAVSVEPR